MEAKEDERQAYHHGDLRAALLVAAEAELSEKGVEGFTLRGCAKRAGVSHAAPAHHFNDANGLLTALAAEGFERFVSAMRERQAEATDPRGKLVAAGLGYVDFAAANPALFRLMFSSFRPDCDHAPLKQAGSTAFGTLVEAVHAIRGVDPREDDAAMLDVAAAWATAHGLADLLLSGRMPFLAAIASDDPDAIYAKIIGRAIPER
jgi:AcrR family transcriptional regulator